MTTRGIRLRLAVLISGGGTNLQALIDRSLAGSLAAEVVVVVSDRPEAYGLKRAEQAGIPHHVVDYRSHMDADPRKLQEQDPNLDLEALDGIQKILKVPERDNRLLTLSRLVSAEKELLRILDSYQPDYVCLAGYMRLVSPFFIQHWNSDGNWRIINIHPSLLPAFPGRHGYEDTFEYGCRWGGVTVHFVDEGEDSGPILAQGIYPIWPDDNIERVRNRGLKVEYEVYAQCVNWLAAGLIHLRVEGSRRAVALITDPEYKNILSGWLRLAFSL